MYKIEKNIPVPSKGTGKKTKYPYMDMNPGDSILVTDVKSAMSVASAAASWVKRNNFKWKFLVRRVDNGVRLWRIK